MNNKEDFDRLFPFVKEWGDKHKKHGIHDLIKTFALLQIKYVFVYQQNPPSIECTGWLLHLVIDDILYHQSKKMFDMSATPGLVLISILKRSPLFTRNDRSSIIILLISFAIFYLFVIIIEKCMENTSSIADLEKKIKTMEDAYNALHTVLEFDALSKAENKKIEKGITIPEAVRVIKDIALTDGQLQNSETKKSDSYYTETLRKKMQDFLKKKNCVCIEAHGKAGTFYKTTDVATAANECYKKYPKSAFITEFEASHNSKPWSELLKKYKQNI